MARRGVLFAQQNPFRGCIVHRYVVDQHAAKPLHLETMRGVAARQQIQIPKGAALRLRGVSQIEHVPVQRGGHRQRGRDLRAVGIHRRSGGADTLTQAPFEGSVERRGYRKSPRAQPHRLVLPGGIRQVDRRIPCGVERGVGHAIDCEFPVDGGSGDGTLGLQNPGNERFPPVSSFEVCRYRLPRSRRLEVPASVAVQYGFDPATPVAPAVCCQVKVVGL